ncbi:MAG: hypothetical protein QXH10_10020, partial [Ignisphaera sp.]
MHNMLRTALVNYLTIFNPFIDKLRKCYVIRTAIFFIIKIIFILNNSFSQFSETIPADYWVYSVIEELKIRGYF